MFHAAFASLSASNPHEGHECSRTHNGLSVLTPQDAHAFVVFLDRLRQSVFLRVRTCTQAFEGTFPTPLPPDSVSFREFDQLLRVEAFDRYEVVFGGVVVREFVKEVTTLSLEIGVALGHNLPLSLPIRGTAFLLRKIMLCAFQPLAFVR